MQQIPREMHTIKVRADHDHLGLFAIGSAVVLAEGIKRVRLVQRFLERKMRRSALTGRP